ncbi:MAG: recombinase RecT [Eubacterium sp.]
MVKNSLTKAQTKTSLAAYLTNDAVKAQISKVVGGKSGDRFISSLLSAVQANPALQECSNSSLVSSAMLGQVLNLSPSPQLGQYYMVPYRDNKTGRKVAQFELGYKGMIQLALRSGQYKKLNVLAIKEGELVKYDPLEEEIEVNLIEDETEREAAPTAGYYAYFEYINGFRKTLYWSKAKMEAHAERYSKGYAAHKGYTFWEKDFDAMAYKTMLRQLISKWGIMSIDMVTAIDADGGVIASDGTVDYVETAEEPIAESPEEPEQAEEPKKECKKEEAIFG